MWIYTTPAVTRCTTAPPIPPRPRTTPAPNWVGVLFAAYNAFAALAAIVIRAWSPARPAREPPANLVFGGLACCRSSLFRDPHWLLLSMLGVGFAWASILSLPYALLSDSVPAGKMGVHGHLQFLHRHPAAGRGQRARAAGEIVVRQPADLRLLIGGASLALAGSFAGARARTRRGIATSVTDGRCSSDSGKKSTALAASGKTLKARIAVPASAIGAGCAQTPPRASAPPPDVYGTLEPFAANSIYFVMTDRFVDGDPSNDHRDQGKAKGAAFFTSTARCPARCRAAATTSATSAATWGIVDNAGYIRGMGFGAVGDADRRQPDEAFTGGDAVKWAACSPTAARPATTATGATTSTCSTSTGRRRA